jgi:hypothetical protein
MSESTTPNKHACAVDVSRSLSNHTFNPMNSVCLDNSNILSKSVYMEKTACKTNNGNVENVLEVYKMYDVWIRVRMKIIMNNSVTYTNFN